MGVFSYTWKNVAPPECRGGVVSFGNFDGVHLGHQTLLSRLKAQAEMLRGPAVAVTFDPHPLALLRPERYDPTLLLTTLEDRANLLREHGADHVLLLRTEADLLQLSAQEFFTNVVRGSLHANGMVEGPNFGFGRGREGNVETLKKCCATTGMALEIVPPLELDGQIISSSRVRESLLAGYIARASRLLGRPYRLTGQVVVGQRRGAGLGFPTANLSDVKTLVPAEGVYAVRARIGDGQEWPAAANIGPNPTFGEMLRKIEVHLIGFTGGELYGQTLTIEFVARLRDTRKFASADDLVRQLREDVAQAELSIRQTTTAMR